MLAHIGDVLMIQGCMVGRVEISEKPGLLWEESQYERLYLRIADEYELIERHRALERKLELVSKTAKHRSTCCRTSAHCGSSGIS